MSTIKRNYYDIIRDEALKLSFRLRGLRHLIEDQGGSCILLSQVEERDKAVGIGELIVMLENQATNIAEALEDVVRRDENVEYNEIDLTKGRLSLLAILAKSPKNTVVVKQ